MPPLYRIRNWNKHFENNRSREVKDLRFVLIPNNLSSDGYVELVSHADGPAHFAVWIVIVQIASRCNPRGTLVRSNGHPHAEGSISAISRLPKQVVTDAIVRLLVIGWLEDLSSMERTPWHYTHLGAEIPHHPDEGKKERKKERRKEGRHHLKNSDEKSQLVQTLQECGVRNKRTFESLALTPGLTVDRVKQLHAKATEIAKRKKDVSATGVLVTSIRDALWNNIRYDTPEAAVRGFEREEWNLVDGVDATQHGPTWSSHGLCVAGALVVKTSDIGKAKFE